MTDELEGQKLKNHELKEKVIVITGVTSGIGLATAKYFSSLGACVIGAARSQEKGQQLVEQLSDNNPNVRFIPTDVTIDDQVKQMVAFVLKEFGRLDFAFNNAGIFVKEPPLHEHEEDNWDAVMNSNLKSVYSCMKHEIKAMLQSNPSAGVIINNASIVGHRGSAASGLAYTTAKHGVIGLTRQAALTYIDQNIRVNAVSPGPTLTAATSTGLSGPEADVNTRLKTLNPTGRTIPTEDIAKTVAFLCSSAASMINGHDIPLDGGQLAKL
jgi:NAD(P)-dependent dehydrogenase (short-subunit alcohol dehydrogenase family)